jgi:hypothetical protein
LEQIAGVSLALRRGKPSIGQNWHPSCAPWYISRLVAAPALAGAVGEPEKTRIDVDSMKAEIQCFEFQ